MGFLNIAVWRRAVSLLVAAFMAVTQIASGVAMAQVQDTEDPVIIHRQAESPGVAGELQTFLARVYDDVEVVGVKLFYRQSAVTNFREIEMRPLLDSIGEYMIAIETSDSEYPGLQYYIEAVDSSGNVTSRGYSYAPIILPLVESTTNPAAEPTPAPIIAQPTQPAEPPPTVRSSSEGFSSRGILFGVGALLLLGALAGGSGGGGDDNGGGGGGTTTPGITLTIISDTPSGN